MAENWMRGNAARGGDDHLAILVELPFYLNGTLDDAARETVERHLSHCAKCRRALASERALASGFTAMAQPVASAAPSEVRLGRQLERRRPRPRPAGRGGTLTLITGWAPLILAGAMAATLAVVVMLVMVEPPEAYRTFADEPTVVPVLRLTLATGADQADLSQMARREGLTVIAGPSEEGFFTLEAPAGADLEALARRLAREEAVDFVEPSERRVGTGF